MGVLLSWPARRMLFALPVLGVFLWSATGAISQSQEIGTRQEIDAAVLQIASVVTRTLFDKAEDILSVEPVRIDAERLTPLGVRLRGALQVTLLRDFPNARLLADSETGAAGRAVRIVVELHPFDDQVIVLVRIIDRDGFLIDAALLEMTRSPGISALLLPAGLSDATPAAEPSSKLWPASSEPSVSSRSIVSRTPVELRPGQSQKRVVLGQEWFVLIASPGFYGLTINSETDQLRASLHGSREAELQQLIRSAPGELVGALFIGTDPPHLRVDAPQLDRGLIYAISFESIAPPRVFADQAWVSQPALGSVGYHTLRVLSQDVYKITLESTSQGQAQATVFELPAMVPTAPQTPSQQNYELAAADYFVLVRSFDGRAVGRVCWLPKNSPGTCS